ncbi:transposase family protein [Streptomyces anulatus]|uniref:transposase family protein n=1 Tax=Streptomyces anulatus TaxID=1892 RepID=UPI003650CCFA
MGSRRCRLICGRQALLILAHLRCGDTCIRLTAGFHAGIATVYQYYREAVDLLAALAPTLELGHDDRGEEGIRDTRRPRATDRPHCCRSVLLLG